LLCHQGCESHLVGIKERLQVLKVLSAHTGQRQGYMLMEATLLQSAITLNCSGEGHLANKRHSWCFSRAAAVPRNPLA
jgi:hypothetical protein